LGLAIVREIVMAHGGTIACESRSGEGTTFRIRFPAAVRETARALVHDGVERDRKSST
jgi:signal transduction histidine kinase